MSRIGSQPVPVPPGVEVTVNGSRVQASGPLGHLEQAFDPRLRIAVNDERKVVRVERDDEERQTKALHGLTRNLIGNMLVGVSQGFTKTLQVVGVGYGGKLQGEALILQIGYSHPVSVAVPEGITVAPPETGSMLIIGVGSVPCVTLRISGTDKQKVGHFAASIRRLKPPEPYKAKGIRYEGEEIRRKAGKAFAAQE